MNYVGGFVAAVPAANKEAFLAHAREALPLFKEVVLFSWIEWPSKDVRDVAMKKMMSDPRMRDMKMPFDGQRMIFGGFQPILDA